MISIECPCVVSDDLNTSCTPRTFPAHKVVLCTQQQDKLRDLSLNHAMLNNSYIGQLCANAAKKRSSGAGSFEIFPISTNDVSQAETGACCFNTTSYTCKGNKLEYTG